MKKALFFVVLLSWLHSHAQQVIKLNDINKLILTTHAGGISGDREILEIVPENKAWKCYQTKRIDYDSKGRRIDDSVRTFKRDVPLQTIRRLLDILSKRDTTIDRKWFNIDKSALVTFIDSLKLDLNPAQRAEFIDSLQSETVIDTTLNAVLHPRLMDDRTYFGITIITKQNTRFTIHAESFADLYDLPWYIDNIKSYDPNITAIFESISGFDNYLEYERKYLYKQMARAVYYKYIKRR